MGLNIFSIFNLPDDSEVDKENQGSEEKRNTEKK